jgi:hypothetical protein
LSALQRATGTRKVAAFWGRRRRRQPVAPRIRPRLSSATQGREQARSGAADHRSAVGRSQVGSGDWRRTRVRVDHPRCPDHGLPFPPTLVVAISNRTACALGRAVADAFPARLVHRRRCPGVHPARQGGGHRIGVRPREWGVRVEGGGARRGRMAAIAAGVDRSGRRQCSPRSLPRVPPQWLRRGRRAAPLPHSPHPDRGGGTRRPAHDHPARRQPRPEAAKARAQTVSIVAIGMAGRGATRTGRFRHMGRGPCAQRHYYFTPSSTARRGDPRRRRVPTAWIRSPSWPSCDWGRGEKTAGGWCRPAVSRITA